MLLCDLILTLYFYIFQIVVSDNYRPTVLDIICDHTKFCEILNKRLGDFVNKFSSYMCTEACSM